MNTMSWYVNIPPKRLDVVEKTINEAQLTDNMHSPEHEQQLAAAKAAAVGILRTGAVGQPPYVTVHMSGHGNAGHVQREGWADSQITVTVQAVWHVPGD